MRSPSGYPVANAKTSKRDLAGLAFTFKAGKFTASSADDAAVDSFQQAIEASARRSLEHPLRLLTIPHLCNVVALTFPEIPDASRVLIEGFVLELITLGRLIRLSTVSNNFTGYSVIHTDKSTLTVRAAVRALQAGLRKRCSLSLKEAERLLPPSVVERDQNVHALLGCLLHDGSATTDAAPGVGIDVIRLPDAPPRF